MNFLTRLVVFAVLGALAVSAAPGKPLPRLADGHPDLQAVWENSTLTPLERPLALGDRAFFTETEAADYVSPERVQERLEARNGVAEGRVSGEIGTDWRETKRLEPSRRASLIVDPPTGRLPALSAHARLRRDQRAKNQREHLADNPEELSLSERCLLWGADPPLVPVSYNNLLQIGQTPATLMIFNEMIHDARVIPLDGRPHLPAALRQWTGDSRGHWDGDTLVVDTTNFTDKTAFQGTSDGLHVVERFTRIDVDTLRYDFLVEDAASFARPWAGTLTMTRPAGPIFEYACHEGNYSIVGILRGARALERERQ